MRLMMMMGLLVAACGCYMNTPGTGNLGADAEPPSVDETTNWTTEGEGYTLSALTERRVPPLMFVHSTHTTTLEQIGEVADATIPKLLDAIKAVDKKPDGPVMFVYHGITEDPEEAFKLEIGYPMDRQANAIGDFPVRVLEPMKALTVRIKGPIDHISHAWTAVHEAAAAQKLEPTGESREIYHVWDGPQGSTNITEVQLGVK